MRDVVVAGVGMTRFGKHLDRSLQSLAEEALGAALIDAGIDSREVDTTYISNAAAGLLTGQEMIRGEVAVRGTELGGGSIINVENACASGGSAAHLAWLAVASAQADVARARSRKAVSRRQGAVVCGDRVRYRSRGGRCAGQR